MAIWRLREGQRGRDKKQKRGDETEEAGEGEGGPDLTDLR